MKYVCATKNNERRFERVSTTIDITLIKTPQPLIYLHLSVNDQFLFKFLIQTFHIKNYKLFEYSLSGMSKVTPVDSSFTNDDDIVDGLKYNIESSSEITRSSMTWYKIHSYSDWGRV